MASMGPSTMTGILRSVRFWCAEELGAFVEERGFGGVEVFRSGEGGVGGVGVASADEPEHLGRGVVMGKMIRSRKRSISRPVRAVVATPAASISWSVTPWRWRWSTSRVQPAGAWPGRNRGSPVRSCPIRSRR